MTVPAVTTKLDIKPKTVRPDALDGITGFLTSG